jgi:hypothetical protein
VPGSTLIPSTFQVAWVLPPNTSLTSEHLVKHGVERDDAGPRIVIRVFELSRSHVLKLREIVPSTVKGSAGRRDQPRARRGAGEASDFTRPKSSRLAPAFVRPASRRRPSDRGGRCQPAAVARTSTALHR